MKLLLDDLSERDAKKMVYGMETRGGWMTFTVHYVDSRDDDSAICGQVFVGKVMASTNPGYVTCQTCSTLRERVLA